MPRSTTTTTIIITVAGAVLTFLAATTAHAQCPAVDFDDLPVDTVVTAQYPGVAFSAPNTYSSCGDGEAYIRNMNVDNLGGTSSGYRALSTRPGPGCEFSPEHLRLVFDRPQRSVVFTIGPYCGTYDVDAYDSPVGGTLVSAQSFEIAGCTSLHGVHRMVTVYHAGGGIRRIEIEDQGGFAAETIDDLKFDVDDTPPMVQVDTPLARACVCDPVPIVGTVNDLDGEYVGDVCDFRSQDDPDWTFYANASGPWVGTLYTWDTTGLPGGYYFVRITGTNACGLMSSDDTLVYLDKQPPTVQVRSPGPPAIVGGTVCFDGSVHESVGTRGGCLDHYTVRYFVEQEGFPVEPEQPVYTSPVHHDPFAHWKTRDIIPDGVYPIEVRAVDVCDTPAIEMLEVIVDNTPPVAELDGELSCSSIDGEIEVFGVAMDEHLRNWVLDFTGDGLHEWVTIDSGEDPVPGDLLATWDTSELPPCAYTLRLRVWDDAVVDCNGAIRNASTFTVSFNIGAEGDFDADFDGDVDLLDFAAFQDAFTGPVQ